VSDKRADPLLHGVTVSMLVKPRATTSRSATVIACHRLPSSNLQ